MFDADRHEMDDVVDAKATLPAHSPAQRSSSVGQSAGAATPGGGGGGQSELRKRFRHWVRSFVLPSLGYLFQRANVDGVVRDCADWLAFFLVSVGDADERNGRQSAHRAPAQESAGVGIGG